MTLSEVVTLKRIEEQVGEQGGGLARRAARGEIIPVGVGARAVPSGINDRRAARDARRDDLVLEARRPVDLVESLVSRALRDLVVACERGSRASLGQVGRDLIHSARQVSAVDRALVALANERQRGAAKGAT